MFNITKIKGRHGNKTRMRGAFVRVAQGKCTEGHWAFLKMHWRREKVPRALWLCVQRKHIFLSASERCKYTQTQTLKSNQWLRRREARTLHFLGVARRLRRSFRSQLEFLLSSLHLVEILFCILYMCTCVIITRRSPSSFSPRSRSQTWLGFSEVLFPRNVTFPAIYLLYLQVFLDSPVQKN